MKITLKQIKQAKEKMINCKKDFDGKQISDTDFEKLGDRLNRSIAKYIKIKGQFFSGNN